MDSTSSKTNQPPSFVSNVLLSAPSGQRSGHSVFSLAGSSPFGRLPSAPFVFSASPTSDATRSKVSSSVKIPFADSPSYRHDPSSGCADAWAPSPKDCSSSFGACPPSLPPSPPASEGGDKEEGFYLFNSSGALADTVPRPELPPGFSGQFEPLPYHTPDDSVTSLDEDEEDAPRRTADYLDRPRLRRRFIVSLRFSVKALRHLGPRPQHFLPLASTLHGFLFPKSV
jgi:hypothetical protein